MKIFFNTIKSIITLTLATTIFIACSKDPENPTDERRDKGHDDATKVEFIIRKGHLHGSKFHADPISAINPIQKFYFEADKETYNWVRKDENGKILTENDPILMIENEGRTVYSLEIIYYNNKNERMNNEFTTSEMLPIHQHFFEVDNYYDTQNNKTINNTENLWTYTYRDTDPENVMVDQLINPTESTRRSVLTDNPLGLKGYFAPKIAYAKFNMYTILYHITKGTKYINNDSSKGFYPFNKAGDELVARSSTDFAQKIPVHIFTSVPDGEAEKTEKYHNDLAKQYNISVEEVKTLLKEEKRNVESSNFYM
ncbi:MAG: hypothetical protein Q3983_08590 [Capnocytophaga sp.]|nr:hypothetical protein [Capnocytophaga sp.]